MKVCNRILAGAVLLLSAAGLLLSLAGGVGVWIVKGPATDRATWLFERIEAKLNVADKGLVHVNESLDRAAKRLSTAQAEQRELAKEHRQDTPARRLLMRTVQLGFSKDLSEAHETVHTVAEAALVVNSVLEDVGSLPFLSVPGLDLDDLTEVNKNLTEVESTAWSLSRFLTELGPDSSDAASTQVSRIERTLKAMRRGVANYEPRLKEVRQRVEGLKSKTLRWITPASILISAAFFWIALSQVSLLCHAWSWWKHPCPSNPRPL